MKSSVKRVHAAEQVLQIQVPRDQIDSRLDAVYRDLQKRTQVPGYRRGKAPRNLLEQRHGSQAKEEAIRQLVSDSLGAALREHQVAVVGRTDVSKVAWDEQSGLSYQATVEVAPQFKLGKYTGIKLTRILAAVTEEQVQDILERVRQAHAQDVPVDGSDQKEQRVPALDDDLAKDVGLGSVAELTQRVRADLQAQHERQADGQLREALAAALLQRVDFEVPPSLVARRAEQLQRDYLTQLLMQGVPEAELPERLKPVEAQIATQATASVKWTFIIQHIAKAEGVTATPEERQQHVAQLAARWQVPLQEVRERFDREQLWESVQQQVVQEKAVTWLLEHAQITTKDG